jgi:predicted ribosomally synthesized peptide with nif11-like leader
MSVENAKTFLNKLDHDSNLLQSVAQMSLVDVIGHANDNGYDFTLEALSEALDEQYGEMDEAELNSVAGGFNPQPEPPAQLGKINPIVRPPMLKIRWFNALNP